MRRYVAPAVRSGMRLALGGDNMHGMQNENILSLLDLGVDLMTALRAATAVGADVLGLDEVGRLAPGKIADFVVVEGRSAT